MTFHSEKSSARHWELGLKTIFAVGSGRCQFRYERLVFVEAAYPQDAEPDDPPLRIHAFHHRVIAGLYGACPRKTNGLTSRKLSTCLKSSVLRVTNVRSYVRSVAAIIASIAPILLTWRRDIARSITGSSRAWQMLSAKKARRAASSSRLIPGNPRASSLVTLAMAAEGSSVHSDSHSPLG